MTGRVKENLQAHVHAIKWKSREEATARKEGCKNVLAVSSIRRPNVFFYGFQVFNMVLEDACLK